MYVLDNPFGYSNAPFIIAYHSAFWCGCPEGINKGDLHKWEKKCIFADDFYCS